MGLQLDYEKQTPFKHTRVFEANLKVALQKLKGWRPIKIINNQGGTGSSKTVSILQTISIILNDNPGWICTVVGSTFPALKKGPIRDMRTKVLVSPFFKAMIENPPNDYHGTDHVFNFKNGSKLEFASFRFPQEARDGKREILYVNEINKVHPDAVKLLVVRSSELIFFDYNSDELFYVHTDYIPRNDCVSIYSNFTHNNHIPEGSRQEILRYRETNWNDWLVLGLGKTGKPSNENPAWFGFKDYLLSTNAEYNPTINIHCTFDQNLRPYMTQICFHLEQVEMTKVLTHYRCTVFDEFCTRPPKNRVVDNCKAFKTKYPRSQHKAYLYYYGDASLNIGSTLAKKGVTGFGQIKAAYKNYLRSNDQSNRTQKSNPPIVLRTEFMNMLLAGEEVGGLKIDFIINPRCEELINDLRFQKMGADGKPIKPKVKDKDGVAYEKYGHTSESLTYAIVRAFSRNFQNFIKAK